MGIIDSITNTDNLSFLCKWTSEDVHISLCICHIILKVIIATFISPVPQKMYAFHIHLVHHLKI